MAQDSFHVLLDQLRAGDDGAAAQFFRRFAHRLLGLASVQLGALLRGKVEPDDVVQSVFKSFFVRQRDGRLDLESWEGVWAVLVVLTVRKCHQKREFFTAARRDVRREVGAADEAEDAVREALGREPTPSEAAEMVETLRHVLGLFEGRERTIVETSLQGYEAAEVAGRLGCTKRKVYRVLARVKTELLRMQAAPA
jgi:RNA polymerase sigma-70 factor (ECF subfamily)